MEKIKYYFGVAFFTVAFTVAGFMIGLLYSKRILGLKRIDNKTKQATINF